MKTIRQYIWLLFTISCLGVSIILINGCQKGDPVSLRSVMGGSDNIITGGSVDVLTENVGAGGGTVTVNKPGDPLDGLQITVPSNSYTDGRSFEVSRVDIKSHNLGQYFNPISPLIKISNGGGYADDVMEVKVPVKVPEGQFAMGFFYDEESGTLEGLPLIALDSTSVTVGTRHFSTSNMSGSSQKALFKGNAESDIAELIISSIDFTVLRGKSDISTDYELREDNWEFGNYGTYLSTGGICAGMSISSAWYFYEKRLKGDNALYSAFDEVDPLWEDNPKGIRFASTIQADYGEFTDNSPLYKLLRKMRNNHDYDFVSWYAFAYSMLITGQPQIVGLTSSNGGHLIVAYGISLAQGTLDVADPNYPDQLRSIQYENDQFQPYSSQLSMNETESSPFVDIGYYAKAALIEWDKIGERWREVENNTIGNDRFPAYSLWVMDSDGSEVELGESYHTDNDTLVVEARCPNAEIFWQGGGKKYIGHEVDDDLGTIRLASTAWGWSGSYYEDGLNTHPDNKMQTATILKPGFNKLGFIVFGWKKDAIDPETQRYIPSWIDFRWVDVTCQKLEIQSGETDGAPILVSGEPNKNYRFIARHNGSAPKQAKYIWTFFDGTPWVTVLNDSTITHAFSIDGNYTIKLQLYDNATNALLGTAQANVTIGRNILDLLHQCNSIQVGFEGLENSSLDGGEPTLQSTSFMFNNAYGIYSNAPALSWSGNTFSVNYTTTQASSVNPDWVYSYTLSISGSVSANGRTINNCVATEDEKLLSDPTGNNTHKKLEIMNLPIDVVNPPGSTIDLLFQVEGDDAELFVSGYEHVYNMFGSNWTAVSLDWVNDLNNTPRKVWIGFNNYSKQ